MLIVTDLLAQIEQAITQSDATKMEAAMTRLVEQKDDMILGAVSGFLASADEPVRHMMVKILAKRGDVRFERLLLNAYSSIDPVMQRSAIDGLLAIAWDHPALQKGLSHDDQTIRLAIIEKSQWEEAIYMEALFEEKDPETQLALLGKIDEGPSFEAYDLFARILRILKSEASPSVAIKASDILNKRLI